MVKKYHVPRPRLPGESIRGVAPHSVPAPRPPAQDVAPPSAPAASPPDPPRAPGRPVKRRTSEITMSQEEVELLQKLGEAEAMSTPEIAPPRPGQKVRRRTTEITMSETEVALLRKLGEPDPEPPAGVPLETSPDETADIVLNRAELDFLISLNEDELPSGGPELVKRSLVESRLRALLAASSGSAGDLLATPVTRPEAEWLDWVTRVRYSFVTQQERRARLVLREKIHTALKALRGDQE